MFGQILSGISGALGGVNSFISSNAASLGMGALGFDLFNSSKQVELNEKVYKLQKKMALHGTQIRVKDMRKAGLNPILAAAGSLGSSGSVQAPNVQLDAAGKLNNAMAFAERAAALKNVEAQTKSIELDNTNKQHLVDYQGGKYDSILNSPIRLAEDDLSSGYRDYNTIVADFNRDVQAGLLSREQADVYKAILSQERDYRQKNNVISKKSSHIPLAVRRQFDNDRLGVASNKTAVEQQVLQNMLTSYNARTLPNEVNQKALNNVLPWLSNASNWLPFIEKLFKMSKKGGRR